MSGSQARLAVYARYAALVAAQERALEDEDLETFDRLAEDRGNLEAGLPATVDPAPGPGTHMAMEQLREALQRDRRMQARLRALRERTRADLKALGEAGDAARRYIRGEGGATGRLDLTL